MQSRGGSKRGERGAVAATERAGPELGRERVRWWPEQVSGRVKGGQHINFAQRTPLANVLLTMLQQTGVPIDKLGDSTGAIAQV